MSDDLSKVYRSSDSFIQRQLDMAEDGDKIRRRLELDIADILTGPTSGGNAQYLADCLCRNRDPKEVAERLIEVGQRYLKAMRKQRRKKM